MPPQAICNVYKKYQRTSDAGVDDDLEVVDFKRGLTEVQKDRIIPVGTVNSDLIVSAQKEFRISGGLGETSLVETEPEECTIYEHQDFPGTVRHFHRILEGSNKR